MLDKLILEHPRSIGETYGEHAGHAVYIGTRLIRAGCACLVHALLPGLCVRTASETIEDIQNLMEQRTARSPLGERPVQESARLT